MKFTSPAKQSKQSVPLLLKSTLKAFSKTLDDGSEEAEPFKSSLPLPFSKGIFILGQVHHEGHTGKIHSGWRFGGYLLSV